jgi:hypothetical protein
MLPSFGRFMVRDVDPHNEMNDAVIVDHSNKNLYHRDSGDSSLPWVACVWLKGYLLETSKFGQTTTKFCWPTRIEKV